MDNARLNQPLLGTLTALALRQGSARVVVRAGEQWRSIEVSNGELRGANSNLPEERIGQLFVELGWIESELVEPIVKEALANHRTFGAQLLLDGLTDQNRINDGLRRQGMRRFEAALTMEGELEMDTQAPGLGGLQRPLGAAILTAFRDRVPMPVVTEILRAPPIAILSRDDRARLADRLEIAGPEARLWRRLQKGELARAIIAASPNDKTVWRFIAGLLAMGLVEWRESRPPIPA